MDREIFLNEVKEKIANLDFIKPGMLPNIDLYMDQVTTFMDSHLKNSKRFEDDKILTKTMINNYAKNDLLPSPDKKKYTNDHMYILTLIYYYKNLLSISDTQTLLNPLIHQYFGGKNEDIKLEDIYNSIYKICRQEYASSQASFEEAFDLSTQMLEDKNLSSKDREYLQIFAYISVLGFDSYLKKTIIEMLLDRLKQMEKDEHPSK